MPKRRASMLQPGQWGEQEGCGWLRLASSDYRKLAIFRTERYHEHVDNSAMQCCIVYHVPTVQGWNANWISEQPSHWQAEGTTDALPIVEQVIAGLTNAYTLFSSAKLEFYACMLMDAYDTSMERQVACQVFLIACIFSIFVMYCIWVHVQSTFIIRGIWIHFESFWCFEICLKNEMFRQKVKKHVPWIYVVLWQGVLGTTALEASEPKDQ